MSFLGGFDGVVSLCHLPTPSLHSTESYHPKKKFRARVLWVDMAIKAIGLTMQKQIVSGRAYEFDGMEIGDIFEGVYFIYAYTCTCACVYMYVCMYGIGVYYKVGFCD